MKVQIIALVLLLSGHNCFSQADKGYSYLKKCTNIQLVDSAEVEIDGLGEVAMMEFIITDRKETGFNYYRIPQNKLRKQPSKLLGYAVNTHIQTWKNNSKVLVHNIHSEGNIKISDLRLHILIENIYMQIVTILDGDTVYEIMSIPDTYNEKECEELTKKIVDRECL